MSRGASERAALENWYRRLLAWYPAEHRRAYGEEMIGVLLASAWAAATALASPTSST